MTTSEQGNIGGEPGSDLPPGLQVGEYLIAEIIGVGGFGTVYRAEHPLIGKAVAIKVLGLKLSADPEMVSRFIAEARSVNQIQSPYIIDIFGFGQLPDGRQYYIMELLDGMPLDEYLDETGCVGLTEAVPILRGIGKALDAAHRNGVAHRDLKPENVFLVSGEHGFRPKLLDFGIAKLLGEKDTMHKTRTGAPIGTPLYMSPEQCRGKGVDHRTDIYAFGCMTYRMLTGLVPFDGEGYMDILFKQIQAEPEPPSQVNRALPSAVDAAVAAMMAKEPVARPESLAAAVSGLEEAALAAGVTIPPGTSSAMFTPLPPSGARGRGSSGGATLSPRDDRGGTPTQMGSARTIAAASPTNIPLAQPRGSRKVTIAVIVVLVALLSAVGVLVFRGGGEAQPKAAALPAPSVDAAPALADKPEPINAAVVTEPPEASPSFVTIEIAGVPRGTEIFWGPRGLIGTAPGKVQLARGDEALSLQLRAEGFAGKTIEVVPDKNRLFEVELEEKAKKRSKRPRKKPRNGAGKGSGKNTLENPFDKQNKK